MTTIHQHTDDATITVRNDIFVNAPAIQPSPDAIEEFRVLTNTFDAEYGRNSGSVVNVVTKYFRSIPTRW